MKQVNLTSENCIFFLGGHDLEMAEIKKLLLAKGFEVKDKNNYINIICLIRLSFYRVII
ncbi:hypothetical protein [Emticicia agri]|uniref:hypothetical protein n=1 Tax=Emticicia agri TaxID=2492393 RepID=UPI0013ECFEF2|nr:hypothetical protein [Emticicia agri]